VLHADRDDLIEELIEEFPGGLSSMGVQEKSLYDLAMHMQAQELRVGKLRTKMDEAEERMGEQWHPAETLPSTMGGAPSHLWPSRPNLAFH